MTVIDIEAFLCVCRYKNISKAAEALHITQATLSIRLKALEEELNCTLFLRRKGKRSLFLTAQGQFFYQLALQHHEIMQKMKSIDQNVVQESLQLSAINSVGIAILPPVLERFLEKHPHIRLTVRDMQADAAHLSILRGKTDLALSTAKMETEQIVATHFFREPFTIVCSEASSYPDIVTLKDLSPRNEIYIEWSAEYAFWHQTVFDNKLSQFELDLIEQLPLFLTKPDRWAIVPQTVAQHLYAHSGIRQCTPVFTIPDRLIYILRHRNNAETPSIVNFLNVLQEVLCERYENYFCYNSICDTDTK